MTKEEQLEKMKEKINKLWEEGYSDSYIVSKVWVNRTSDISINDVSAYLNELNK